MFQRSLVPRPAPPPGSSNWNSASKRHSGCNNSTRSIWEPTPPKQLPFQLQPGHASGANHGTTSSLSLRQIPNQSNGSQRTIYLPSYDDISLEPDSNMMDKGQNQHGGKKPHWLQMEQENAIPHNNMAAVFSALMLCVFAAALDQSVVAPALPTIAAELHASAAGYSYVPFSSQICEGRLQTTVGFGEYTN